MRAAAGPFCSCKWIPSICAGQLAASNFGITETKSGWFAATLARAESRKNVIPSSRARRLISRAFASAACAVTALGAVGSLAKFGEMNALAAGPSYQALVCIFMAGGNDGDVSYHNDIIGWARAGGLYVGLTVNDSTLEQKPDLNAEY